MVRVAVRDLGDEPVLVAERASDCQSTLPGRLVHDHDGRWHRAATAGVGISRRSGGCSRADFGPQPGLRYIERFPVCSDPDGRLACDRVDGGLQVYGGPSMNRSPPRPAAASAPSR